MDEIGGYVETVEGACRTALDRLSVTVREVVLSSTLTEPLERANPTLITGDGAEAVHEMKAERTCAGCPDVAPRHDRQPHLDGRTQPVEHVPRVLDGPPGSN